MAMMHTPRVARLVLALLLLVAAGAAKPVRVGVLDNYYPFAYNISERSDLTGEQVRWVLAHAAHAAAAPGRRRRCRSPTPHGVPPRL